MTEDNLPYEVKERGVYISLLEDHPGFVKFPVPLTAKHYKDWRAAEKKSTEDKEEAMFAEWNHALALIEDWQISSIPQSALKPGGDEVPLEVLQWVRLVAMNYILDAVSLKNLRAPSETT